MATYGLTPTGFVIKTLETLATETTARITSLVGVVPTGALESLMMAFLASVAEVWELLEAIVSGRDPDSATGVLQDAIAAITGTIRNPATVSTAKLSLTGTPNTLITSGSQAKSSTTGKLFATKADAKILGIGAWTSSTNYVIDDRRHNTGKVYVCIATGMSAGGGGPSSTGDDIADGGAHWRYIGDGTGVVDVDAECTETGPVIAISGDITIINTPAGGWSGVRNLADAKVGSNVESHEELRVRREEELSQAGTGTAAAIRASVLEVRGVTSCKVFSNEADTTVDGMPPHSWEVLVRGGDANEIATMLLREHVTGGITVIGTDPAFAVDEEGYTHDIPISRPTEKNIGVIVNVEVSDEPGVWPSDGVAQIKAAIVAFGNAQKPGKNAVASSIGAQAFKVPGVTDVTSTLIVAVSAPSTPGVPVASTTIPIAAREQAVYSTSWITVNVSVGTP